MVYNGYYKVMSNIPKMGQLPTPDEGDHKFEHHKTGLQMTNKRILRFCWYSPENS